MSERGRDDRQYWSKPKKAASGYEAWWYANERGSISVYIHDGEKTVTATIPAAKLREFVNMLDRYRR